MKILKLIANTKLKTNLNRFPPKLTRTFGTFGTTVIGKESESCSTKLEINFFQTSTYEYVLEDMHLATVQMPFSPVHEPVPRVVSVPESEAQRIPVHATLKVSRTVYRLLTSGGEAAPTLNDLDMC